VKKKWFNEEAIGVILLLVIVGSFYVAATVLRAKCKWPGCNNPKAYASNYCESHSYANENDPLFQDIMKPSKKHTSLPDSSKWDPSNSKMNQRKRAQEEQKKHEKPSNTYTYHYSAPPSSHYYDAYDDGYDSVYDDGDYDLDRYLTDDDYASGVDDALDELDE